MPACSIRLALTLGLLLVPAAAAGDWPRFRGPNGTGICPDQTATPTTWSPTENVAWKVALPGPGFSCPIVVGKRVFVTSYSGYGTSRGDTADQSKLTRHLTCVDRDTGKIRWSRAVPAVLPEDPYSGPGVPTHGYASHTPVSDGERVYVFFGKTGALAFDMDGQQLWQTSVGTESDPHGWGSASSPILFENLLIVPATAESEALVALDKKTGRQVWRQEAAGFANTWGTPTLARTKQGRTDLVLGVPYEVWGLDPATGKLLWYCEAINTDQYPSSVVESDGIVYGIEGRGGGSIAIRVGGKGDVTKSNVVWSGRDSTRFSSPLVLDGRLYFVSNGIANCVEAATGKKIYQERLASGNSGSQANRGRGRGGFGSMDFASPVFADGKIYCLRSSGEMAVLKIGPKFKQLATNRLTTDREQFSATPAISNGQIFVRSNKHLYCIAARK